VYQTNNQKGKMEIEWSIGKRLSEKNTIKMKNNTKNEIKQAK